MVMIRYWGDDRECMRRELARLWHRQVTSVSAECLPGIGQLSS
jgi:hypothetical protein